jgi:hypothetical protein
MTRKCSKCGTYYRAWIEAEIVRTHIQQLGKRAGKHRYHPIPGRLPKLES